MRVLIEEGLTPADAITLVRRHRRGAIETRDQEQYVLHLGRRRKARKQIRPDSSEDWAVGCLTGLAVGDALGTTLEFSARDSLPPVTELVGGGPFQLNAGEWTDDTSMALCLADSLLAQGTHLPGTALVEPDSRDWRQSNCCRRLQLHRAILAVSVV